MSLPTWRWKRVIWEQSKSFLSRVWSKTSLCGSCISPELATGTTNAPDTAFSGRQASQSCYCLSWGGSAHMHLSHTPSWTPAEPPPSQGRQGRRQGQTTPAGSLLFQRPLISEPTGTPPGLQSTPVSISSTVLLNLQTGPGRKVYISNWRKSASRFAAGNEKRQIPFIPPFLSQGHRRPARSTSAGIDSNFSDCVKHFCDIKVPCFEEPMGVEKVSLEMSLNYNFNLVALCDKYIWLA